MKGIDVQSSSNFARLILHQTMTGLCQPALISGACGYQAGEARMQDAHYFKALLDQIEQGGLQALMQFLMDRDLNGTNLRKFHDRRFVISSPQPRQCWAMAFL